VTANVREWLRRLDETHQKATPGVWTREPNYRLQKGCRCLSCWEPVEGSWDINPVDGPDCPEHGCWHNISVSAEDAAAIVSDHNAVPDLIAALTAVLDLADELEAASGLPTTHGEFDRGVAAHQRDAAERLRAAVAAPLAGHDNEAMV
jgi:hypothetical protein